jgi:hypothetical protein
MAPCLLTMCYMALRKQFPDFGPLRAVERLGANVWRGVTRQGRPVEVVVKRIRRDRVMEARLAARFKHPALVPVIQHGLSPAGYILVRPWIEGVDLAALMLARGRFLPWEVGAHVARELARAAAWTHALVDGEARPHGLIASPVSATNVIIGSDGEVRLLGCATDAYADQLALGELLHATCGHDVPAGVSYLAGRMTAFDPMERLTSFDEVVRALDRLLAGVSGGSEYLAAHLRGMQQCLRNVGT